MVEIELGITIAFRVSELIVVLPNIKEVLSGFLHLELVTRKQGEQFDA